MANATYEIWADWFQYHEEGKELVNVSVTKSLAAAGDYAAGDVLSEHATSGTAWTFSGVVKQNGCSGEITKAQAICETTGLTPRLTLYLFMATPTSQVNDNVANTALLHADLANYIGKIDFPAMEDLGGDSEAIVTPSTYGNLPLTFTCASGANDLFGVLITRDVITSESAGDDMVINLTIEQSYLGEDLTGDVKSISFSRGKSNELGFAEVGQCSITLNNSSGNYSPSTSGGAYYNYLKPKRIIGIRSYDSDYNYQLFYGFVEEIIPHPHLSQQDAIITATDGIDFLSRHDIATALYKNAKTGTIHDYILTDANWLRLARLDDGQDIIPYWYGHDVKARFAQEEIDTSEQGFSYIDGCGYFNFEDRYHRSTAEHQTSGATFNNTMSDITYSLNSRNIFNIIKVTVTPWELQVSTTLWTLEETPSIPAGEARTWWADASVSGESVFVDAWTTLVATTDYVANSQSDGGGSNMTSDIAVTLSKFAKTMKITLTNNSSVPAYITLLQARGTYYDDKTKVTLKAEDSTSQDDYQKRTFEIDGKYMTDADKANDYVTYAVGKYKKPRAELSMMLLNQNSTILANILDLEISDRITAINDKLGLNDDYFIDYMEHDISMSGKSHIVNYRLADTINEDFWCLDYSALASTTTSGQTKLGY